MDRLEFPLAPLNWMILVSFPISYLTSSLNMPSHAALFSPLPISHLQVFCNTVSSDLKVSSTLSHFMNKLSPSNTTWKDPLWKPQTLLVFSGQLLPNSDSEVLTFCNCTSQWFFNSLSVLGWNSVDSKQLCSLSLCLESQCFCSSKVNDLSGYCFLNTFVKE